MFLDTPGTGSVVDNWLVDVADTHDDLQMDLWLSVLLSHLPGFLKGVLFYTDAEKSTPLPTPRPLKSTTTPCL